MPDSVSNISHGLNHFILTKTHEVILILLPSLNGKLRQRKTENLPQVTPIQSGEVRPEPGQCCSKVGAVSWTPHGHSLISYFRNGGSIPLTIL